MNTTDLILAGAALVGVGASWLKSPDMTRKALRIGVKQFVTVLPFFVAVFAAIGLFEVLITPAQIQSVLGSGRGAVAPVLAAVFGGLATGPPAAVFPLGKYLLEQHGSVAAVATLLIAWVAVGTVTLPVEIRYFGARFAFVRWGLTMALSVVLGVVMGWLL